MPDIPELRWQTDQEQQNEQLFTNGRGVRTRGLPTFCLDKKTLVCIIVVDLFMSVMV